MQTLVFPLLDYLANSPLYSLCSKQILFYLKEASLYNIKEEKLDCTTLSSMNANRVVREAFTAQCSTQCSVCVCVHTITEFVYLTYGFLHIVKFVSISAWQVITLTHQCSNDECVWNV